MFDFSVRKMSFLNVSLKRVIAQAIKQLLSRAYKTVCNCSGVRAAGSAVKWVIYPQKTSMNEWMKNEWTHFLSEL